MGFDGVRHMNDARIILFLQDCHSRLPVFVLVQASDDCLAARHTQIALTPKRNAPKYLDFFALDHVDMRQGAANDQCEHAA